MNQQTAIQLIAGLIEEAEAVRADWNLFNAWRRKGRTVLDRVFGEGCRQVRDFVAVDFRFRRMHTLGDNRPLVRAFDNGIEKSKEVLRSFIWEIEQFGLSDTQQESGTADSVQIVRKLLSRFHAVARQLRDRHDNRPTLDVSDEYDVQDLLHALLRVHFDDVRPEEWTPSYAGKSARMDFLLKNEQIIIEVKKTRNGLGAKEVADQLIVDIARYQGHPDCGTLICFVYDPEGRVGNARGIENDLSKDREALNVMVVVRPE